MENSSLSFTSESLENVRKGQRFMLFGLVANLVMSGLGQLLDLSEPVPLGMALLAMGVLAGALGVIGFCILGIWKVVRGLSLSIFWVIFGGLAMFIPLLNLIVLLSLSGKASKVLKEYGYEVGLLGAAKK